MTYKLTNYHDILLHYTLRKKGWLENVKTTKNLKIASRQIWVAHYFNAIYSTYSKTHFVLLLDYLCFWRIYGRNYNEFIVTQINSIESLFLHVIVELWYDYFIKARKWIEFTENQNTSRQFQFKCKYEIVNVTWKALIFHIIHGYKHSEKRLRN